MPIVYIIRNLDIKLSYSHKDQILNLVFQQVLTIGT